ncbi:MAG: hypothetical protein U0992_05385 [Planctomycetaceae bacterium]
MERTAEEIRGQMRLIRQRVRAEAINVLAGANRLKDWRFYPRQFPWVTVGAAAALGFSAIPQRRRPTSAAAANLPGTVHERQHIFTARADRTDASSNKTGLAAGLFSTVAILVVKHGLPIAARYFGRRLNEVLVHETFPERRQ